MSIFSLHLTANPIRLSAPVGFALRLLIPILIICLLPAEEEFFQNLFLGEGFLRVLHCAWSFRSTLLLSIKKTGLCGLIFGLEEFLQEICLYFLL